MAHRQDSTRLSSERSRPTWRLERGGKGVLIGMVHLAALPGAPTAMRTVRQIAREAALEAVVLAKAGFDGVLVENMHDAPYVGGDQPPQVVAAFTVATLAVLEALETFRSKSRPLPVGVQILAAGNREALAVSLAVGAAYIRAENFVFAHVADEGLMGTAQAGPLLRYRREIGAEHVAVWADIKKKHAAHSITADVTLAEACEAAEFFRADGLIITGRATGKATNPEDVATAREATELPIVVGSGVTPATAKGLLRHADALIVGSSLKRGGDWRGPVDAGKAEKVVAAARG